MYPFTRARTCVRVIFTFEENNPDFLHEIFSGEYNRIECTKGFIFECA